MIQSFLHVLPYAMISLLVAGPLVVYIYSLIRVIPWGIFGRLMLVLTVMAWVCVWLGLIILVAGVSGRPTILAGFGAIIGVLVSMNMLLRYKRPAPKGTVREHVFLAGREFFQNALVAYLLLVVAETLKEGVVSNFFNLNWLLGVVLVSGVVMVLADPEPDTVDPSM
jgi:hypothetical protein